MPTLSEARGIRPHIGFYGVRNAGKSSLLNALVGEEIAVVSDQAGTTTDPVLKNMELPGLGAVTFMDTAGFDDIGSLGTLRVEKTFRSLQKCDLALVVFTQEHWQEAKDFTEDLEGRKVPYLLILNKIDQIEALGQQIKELEQIFQKTVWPVSSQSRQGIANLRAEVVRFLSGEEEPDLLRGLVQAGDSVLLVMPQDIQAPKGRLILPQVQTIRALLDAGCVITSVTFDQYEQGLASLVKPPHLIITDSQVFAGVSAKKPEESQLTSFSILFAAYKGDVDYFIASAKKIDTLSSKSRILIAEACSHPPGHEDIGTVKIPATLQKRFGNELSFDFVRGDAFPSDLRAYDLVIHCGACMFNRSHVLRRSDQAKEQGVPMTNYGLALAHLQGILDQVVIS